MDKRIVVPYGRGHMEADVAEGSPIYLVANTETFFEPYDDARLEPYTGIFDAIYYFSLTGLAGIPSEEENRRAADFCRRHGKRYMPCLHPGYFGAWMRGRNDCYQPFRGVDRLFDHLQSAMTFAGESPWLHVTTWNDHDETTLQPRRLTPADGLLLAAYANAYHGRPPAQVPEVVFAYHREELPGTLIRIEAQRLAMRTRSVSRPSPIVRNSLVQWRATGSHFPPAPQALHGPARLVPPEGRVLAVARVEEAACRGAREQF